MALHALVINEQDNVANLIGPGSKGDAVHCTVEGQQEKVCEDVLGCIIAKPMETFDFVVQLSEQLAAVEEVAQVQTFVPNFIDDVIAKIDPKTVAQLTDVNTVASVDGLLDRILQEAASQANLVKSLLSDPDKEQFSRMRTAAAIVFFRPQTQLPDLFLAGKEEPLYRYQPRWVKTAGGHPANAKVTALEGTKFEAFCHDATAAAYVISPELIELQLESGEKVTQGIDVVVSAVDPAYEPPEGKPDQLTVLFETSNAAQYPPMPTRAP